MPPRSEVTEATAARASDTAAARAGRVNVPPFEHWVSRPVRVLIEHAPTNPSLRTLIRNEMDIVLPRVDTPNTTAKVKAWLNDHFHETTVYKLKLKPHYDAGHGSIPRLYNDEQEDRDHGVDAQPTRAPRAGGGGGDQLIAALTGAPPVPVNQFPVDEDGSFIMRGIHMSGTEYGRAQFEATIIYAGEIRIPADVVRGGRDAVVEFLRNNRQDLNISTETYLYPEEGFVSERVNLTSIQINEEHLRAALAQVAGGQAVAAPATR